MSQLALDLGVAPELTQGRSQRRDGSLMHSLLQVGPGCTSLGLGKARVQLERLAKLLDGLVVLACVEVVPAEMAANDQVQRFQLERALALGQRLIGPSERNEAVRVPVMRGRVLGIQLEGTPELLLGGRQVPVIKKMNLGQGVVRFRQRAVDL